MFASGMLTVVAVVAAAWAIGVGDDLRMEYFNNRWASPSVSESERDALIQQLVTPFHSRTATPLLAVISHSSPL